VYIALLSDILRSLLRSRA